MLTDATIKGNIDVCRVSEIDEEILALKRFRSRVSLSEWGSIAAEIEALTREKASLRLRDAALRHSREIGEVTIPPDEHLER